MPDPATPRSHERSARVDDLFRRVSVRGRGVLLDNPLKTKPCPCGCGITVEDGFDSDFYFEDGKCRECGESIVSSRMHQHENGTPCLLHWVAVLSAQLNRHAEELAKLSPGGGPNE